MKAWQFFMQTYQNDYSVLWPSKFGAHSAFCSQCRCDFSIACTSHSDIVHHTTDRQAKGSTSLRASLCVCKFHVWYLCVCMYVYIFQPDITVLRWLGVNHQVTYCMYVLFYVCVGILWIDLRKGVCKSKHVLVWKRLLQIFAYLGDFSRPALLAWLIPTSSHIYMRRVFTFEMCICFWWNLVDLRWPCVVDRMLKSSYYFN